MLVSEYACTLMISIYCPPTLHTHTHTHTDIDECTNTPGPCDPDTEVCVNLEGTFSCRCTDGLVKNTDGQCISPPKKTKKKRKNKSKKGELINVK